VCVYIGCVCMVFSVTEGFGANVVFTVSIGETTFEAALRNGTGRMIR
jgi:hypothetical protein